MESTSLVDILVVALPADRKRAEEIIDGLHDEKVAGAYRTRFLTEHPSDPKWEELVRGAENVPCVVFCWSKSTSSNDAAPYRAFAAYLLAKSHVISVELEEAALPLEMTESTSYPLFGWRARLHGWRRFVFGNAALKQIAVAAARKVSGQDPPPPQAFWRMVRAQAWVAIVGAFALLGTMSTFLDFYSSPISRALDREHSLEFSAFKRNPTCSTARTITLGGGPFADEARAALFSCHIIKRWSSWKDSSLSLPIFGLTKTEASRDAQEKCGQYVQNIDARSRNVGGDTFQIVDFAPGGNATARCFLTVRTLQDVEVMR